MCLYVLGGFLFGVSDNWVRDQDLYANILHLNFFRLLPSNPIRFDLSG